MHVCEIITADIANGPGIRLSLFVSGCRNRCPGCFQPETWAFDYGRPFTPELEADILEELKRPFYAGLTVLGGEPMEPENQADLLPFIRRVRAAYPRRTIWVYTGYLYEDLLPGGRRHTPATDGLMDLIDVLVDGRFEERLKDIRLAYKGSANQRIIDVRATRVARRIVIREMEAKDGLALASEETLRPLSQ